MLKAWFDRLIERLLLVDEDESQLDRWDRPPHVCQSCLDGYGRLHRCESPEYCDCTNAAVHF